MASLSDEERRALNLLAGHPDGCDEAVLLADSVTVGQLAGLVIDGYATGSVAAGDPMMRGLSEMSPTSIAPTCPHCAAPLRLIRVLPRVPPDAPVETRTFRCGGCGKMTTRTVRIDDDRA
jgi:hypothetical protein